ncbi:hypothetical protein D9611_013980 [Ephemerocybe angulata]|uniref:F-box domain-containing protein n=1 Tax=Ephemerocybe angulata TaxID=980116 RepID=A0A8H5ARJ1_9AGAR|nr:hypothetical protein D9611_013980 [Tulosesus angulatus]
MSQALDDMVSPPRYSALLSSNYPPNALEKATIERDIIELEDRLSRMRSAVSPVRSLLPEILGQIFESAVMVQDAPQERVDSARVVDLSLVCKAWRAAAELTHSLWADVLIAKPGPQTFDKVVAWMGRAGTTPKTLRIRLSNPNFCCLRGHLSAWGQPDPLCVLDAAPLLELLTEGLQLDTFEISVRSSFCLRLLLLRAQEATSKGSPWMSLRSLDLRICDQDPERVWGYWNWQEPPDPDSMFNHLPSSLTSLRIRFPSESPPQFTNVFRPETPFRRYYIPINIPASTLRNLISITIACDWEGPQIARLLQYCTRVEYLDIDYETGWGQLWTREATAFAWYGLPPRLHFPELRTLKVHHIPSCAAGHVLHFIDAPALSRIHVGIKEVKDEEGPGGDDEGEPLTIIRPTYLFLDSLGLLHPPRATMLQSLTISNQDFCEKGFSGKAFISILSPFLSLTHLTVVGVSFGEEKDTAGDSFAVMRWSMDDQQTFLLPCLEHLEIADCYEIFPLESLLRFIEARHRRYEAFAEGDKAPDSLKMVVLRDIKNVVTLEEDCESARALEFVRGMGITVECIRSPEQK